MTDNAFIPPVIKAAKTGTLMVQLGHTYANLMVDVIPFNAKLRRRSLSILQRATGLAEDQAKLVMSRAGGSLKLAIVMGLTGAQAERARATLDAVGGVAHRAIEAILSDVSAHRTDLGV